MKLNVQTFGQRDSQWVNKLLGTSSVTIGNYGCLLTCLTMLLKYYGKDTNPDKLNQALININGYANANLYKWYEGITKLYTDITITKLQNCPNPLTDTDINAIKAELDAGRPVIAQVDFIPATAIVDMHFVLIIGYEGDTFYVNDPWYGDIAALTRYGDQRITVQQYTFHSGPVPSLGDLETLPVKKTDFERLVTKATALDNQNPTYIQLQAIIKEMDTQLEGIRAENKSRLEFVQKVAALLGVPVSNDAIIGDITATLAKEQNYDATIKSNEILTEKLKEATTLTETQKKKIEDDAGLLLTATRKSIEDGKTITTLTIDRDAFKDLYEKAILSKGLLSQFTKKEISNYLFKNWFNSKAFAKEK